MPTYHLSSTQDDQRSEVCHRGLAHEIAIHPFVEICKSPQTTSNPKRLVLSSSTPEPVLIHGDPFFHFLPRVCIH